MKSVLCPGSGSPATTPDLRLCWSRDEAGVGSGPTVLSCVVEHWDMIQGEQEPLNMHDE